MRIKYKATGHEREVPDAIGQTLINRKLAYQVGVEPAPKKSRAPRKAASKPAAEKTRAVKADTSAGESDTPNTYLTRDLRAED